MSQALASIFAEKDARAGAYDVFCTRCGALYDATASDWCACITDNPTFVCPHCGSCFCSEGPEFRRRFWESAPEELLRRRFAKKGFRSTLEPPLEEGNPLRRPLILVADDELDTRLVAYRVLMALGYGVVLAKNGMEAIHLARKYRPDLVLTDQMMPVLDGKHMCKRLKEDPETREIPIILMTGLYKRESQRIEVLREFKADDFLTKPIPFERLGEVMEGWLTPVGR